MRLARWIQNVTPPTAQSASWMVQAAAVLENLSPQEQASLHGLLSKLNDRLEALLDGQDENCPARTIPSLISSGIMQIELHCTQCSCSFAAAPETPMADVMERMKDEGPWFALANGDTFEDMVWAALLSRGAIYCPACGKPVSVREPSLGSLVDTFGQWEGAGRPPGGPKRLKRRH
jgi:hypothetical protein